jgi:alpha-1,2-mannosyltransferase
MSDVRDTSADPHVGGAAEQSASAALPPRTSPRMPSIARRRIALWAGTLLCLGWLSHGWEVAGSGLATRSGTVKGADYIQFYLMGSRVKQGRGDLLYDMTKITDFARSRISPRLEHHPERNPYGPQVALAFAPLAQLPFLPSLAVFSLISACFYSGAVWLLWRHAAGLHGDGRYVALVAAAYPALLVTLRFGQISTVTLVAPALVVAALAANRRFLAGMCLGVLAYKPQLLVVAVPVLVVARDWRGIMGVVVAGAAQLTIAWAAVGAGVMEQYALTLAQVTQRPDVVMLYPENSHSLRGFLRLLGVPPTVASAVSVACVLACAVPLARTWRGGAPPLMRVSALILLTLLLTPHLITYDLLLLAVPIVAIAEWAATHTEYAGARRAMVVAVMLYCASFSPVLAEHAHIQLSTLAIAAGVWIIWPLTGGTESNRVLSPQSPGEPHAL